jgi:tetratricopeptide (TPR) repeat protein
MVQPTSAPPVISTLSSALIHTPTPSNTAAPAATLTQTATSSSTPAEPTATPSEAVTVNPFQPGDPTATPLGNDVSDPNFTAGVKAYKDKAYPKVISLMSAVIESQPDLAPPYRYRGLAYWYLKDCRSGMADLQKALSLDPNYAAAWAARGLLNDCLGNKGQMLQDYQKALSLDPSLAVVHHNLGVYYYDLQDYKRSLEEYQQAVAIDPSRSGAWSGIAEALSKLGRYDECIQYASRALTADAKEWLAYSDRAFCNMEKKNYKAAAADYKVYVNAMDAKADEWYNYAITLRHSGNLKESLAAYTKAIDLDPSFYPAHINRGVVYLDLKKCDEALSDFNAALKSGDISLAYSGRGDAYSCLKKYDLAMPDYEKTLSLYPDNAAAYCGQAIVFYEVGRYQDALDAAANSNRIDPSCGGQRLMEIQGRSYYALGDYDRALTFMNKALAVSPYSLGYYYRGLIHQAAGRKAEAVRDLEKFLSLAGSSGNLGAEVKDAKARLARLK